MRVEELKMIVDGAMSQLARAKVKCDSVREGISTLLCDIEIISQERDQAISLLKSLSDILGCSPVMLDVKVKQLKEIADSKSPGVGSLPKTGFIRRFQLAKALGIHVATIDRWVNDGNLPAPVKPGEKVTAFRAEEIQDWLKSKSAKDESEW